MKKILGLLSLSLLLFTGCGATDPEVDFSLNLYLRSEEQSEDSNSITETLSFDGIRGNYSWAYDGYYPGEEPPSTEESIKFTEEQIESLKLFIKDKMLNQDLEEKADQSGDGRTVDLTLDITMDGETTHLNVSGMSDRWLGEETGTNLENYSLVESAEDLIYTVKDLAGLLGDR